MAIFLLAMALSAECGSLALKADDCRRETRVWEQARAASYAPWVVIVSPQTA